VARDIFWERNKAEDLFHVGEEFKIIGHSAKQKDVSCCFPFVTIAPLCDVFIKKDRCMRTQCGQGNFYFTHLRFSKQSFVAQFNLFLKITLFATEIWYMVLCIWVDKYQCVVPIFRVKDNMGAARSSKMSMSIYQGTQCHSNLHCQRCEELTSRLLLPERNA
jgi:hypothetical protein